MTSSVLFWMKVARGISAAILMMLYINVPGEQVAKADVRCLQCLFPGGCTNNCCHCSNPEHSAYALNGCGPGGTVTLTCSDGDRDNPTYSSTICEQRQCCKEVSEWCVQDGECCTGICNQIDGQCSTNPSPILINLEANARNYRLTSSQRGVAFDLNSDGVAERIAWTRADSPIAFLVRDLDRNGRIDNGGELFGTFTRKRNGDLAANGFGALLDLDGGPDVSDGKIDSDDPIFVELALWVDSNHNGTSEPGEIATLTEAGVAAVFTSYETTPRVDRHGNRYWLEGTALVIKNGRERPRRVYDVIFATMPTTD